MIKARLFKIVPKSGKLVVIIVILKLLQLAGMVCNFWQMSRLLNVTFASISDLNDFQKSSIMFIISTLIQFMAGIKQQKYIDVLASQAKLTLRSKVFKKISSLGSSYKQKINSGELLVVSSEGIEQLEAYYAQYMPQFFYSLTAPLFLFAIVYRISTRIAWVLLAGIPVIPMSIVAVMKIAKRILGKYTKQYRGLGDSFLDAINGLTTLKIYGTDQIRQKQIERDAESFRKMTMNLLIFQLNSISVMDVSMLSAVSFGFISAMKQFSNSKIPFGNLFFILFIAIEFYNPLRLMGSYFHIAMNGISQSASLFKILDLPEPDNGTETIKDTAADISLHDVSISFGSDKQILRNVNINVPHNQITCIVGASGSGKSTIANIVFKRLRNYSGKVSFGDQDIKQIRASDLYNHVSMISTNSYVFQGSIEENVRLGKLDATKEEIIECLKKVNLYDFVEQNGGLNMQINEGAANISGGQRQRLALARALISNSDIYIFDEATSNIDVESEDMINNVIQELKKTKTILLITHRLHNCIHADNIYILNNGEIVESGSHQILMNNKSKYYEMFNSQQDLEQYSNNSGNQQEIIKIQFSGSTKVTRKTEQQQLVSKRQPGLIIMFKLIMLITAILPQIVFAVLFGILGFMCVINLPKYAVNQSMNIVRFKMSQIMAQQNQQVVDEASSLGEIKYSHVLLIMIGIAFLRGFFHYLEHYFNHYIAFRILAILRSKIFKHLRSLAPAKLADKNKGDLITTLTTDIEILEVFYAHTISPICISIGMTVIVTKTILKMSKQLGIAYCVSSLWIQFGIPFFFSRISRKTGVQARDKFSKLSGKFLDTIKGIDEVIQYNGQDVYKQTIEEDTKQLNKLNNELRYGSSIITGIAYFSIAACVQTIIYLSIYHMHLKHINLVEMYNIIIISFNGFGAQLAVANLTASHFTVLAAGDRLLKLLSEKPVIKENKQQKSQQLISIQSIKFDDVSFGYNSSDNQENIIQGISIDFTTKDQIVGIHGRSGLGKSTILRLMMRFYDPQSGKITINDTDLKDINMEDLHKQQSLVEQETILFNGTIAENIKVGRADANNIDIIEAADKAGLLDFINSLPEQFETQVGELGDRLSSGEKQRISLARAFLHNSSVLLFDEPTSNLDSLNEKALLKQLDQQRDEKLVVIVSHRESTLGICKKILEVQ